jgi:hypothetical protein
MGGISKPASADIRVFLIRKVVKELTDNLKEREETSSIGIPESAGKNTFPFFGRN